MEWHSGITLFSVPTEVIVVEPLSECVQSTLAAGDMSAYLLHLCAGYAQGPSRWPHAAGARTHTRAGSSDQGRGRQVWALLRHPQHVRACKRLHMHLASRLNTMAAVGYMLYRIKLHRHSNTCTCRDTCATAITLHTLASFLMHRPRCLFPSMHCATAYCTVPPIALCIYDMLACLALLPIAGGMSYWAEWQPAAATTATTSSAAQQLRQQPGPA